MFNVFCGLWNSDTVCAKPCDVLFDYLIESLEIMQEEHHTAALFFASQNS